MQNVSQLHVLESPPLYSILMVVCIFFSTGIAVDVPAIQARTVAPASERQNSGKPGNSILVDQEAELRIWQIILKRIRECPLV